VVLNVEPEHLENYDESETELWRAFEMFTQSVGHTAVLNQDAFQRGGRLDTSDWAYYYGLDNGHLTASNIRVESGATHFDLSYHFDGPESIPGLNGPCSLPIPGVHNVSNALAALSAAGIVTEAKTFEEARSFAQTLSTFAGTLRRFEKKGEVGGVVFYDDYGHHPTEVKATLEAAKEFLERPICVIFQPHRYSRTQHLGKDFGGSFGAADKIIITQLYSAFEEPIPGVSGRIVYDAVRESFPEKTVRYAETLDEARQLALEQLAPGDALLTMGAGDITKLGPILIKEWEARRGD
jgi:UDP-N-acetylmuramate--alanine ligase